jgi:thiamine-phosphate pyrophosphorylase
MLALPRFYPVVDAASLERRGCPLVATAAAILEGGARVIQFRVKAHFSRRYFEAAERIAALCREAGALFIIDDRADIAALIDRAGVHLGQDDLPPAAARSIVGPGRVIGFSTHNAGQLALAADETAADYLAIGPVFPTGSKARPDPVLGCAALAPLRALTARPLVAIGGITRETAGAVLAAGIDSVAVIGDLLPEVPTAAAIRARAVEWVELTAHEWAL